MKRQEQDDPKFDRKTKALKRHQRLDDEQREADQQIERLMRGEIDYRKALEY